MPERRNFLKMGLVLAHGSGGYRPWVWEIALAELVARVGVHLGKLESRDDTEWRGQFIIL